MFQKYTKDVFTVNYAITLIKTFSQNKIWFFQRLQYTIHPSCFDSKMKISYGRNNFFTVLLTYSSIVFDYICHNLLIVTWKHIRIPLLTDFVYLNLVSGASQKSLFGLLLLNIDIYTWYVIRATIDNFTDDITPYECEGPLHEV